MRLKVGSSEVATVDDGHGDSESDCGASVACSVPGCAAITAIGWGKQRQERRDARQRND